MKVNRLIAALPVALSFLIAHAVLADARPRRNIEGFQIKPGTALTLDGEGCPSNSVTGIVNGGDVAIIFSKFKASAPPGTSSAVNCNVVIPLEIPQGYTVEPVKVAYQGSVDLSQKGSASVRTVLSWGGRSRTHDNFRLDSIYGENYVGGWDRTIDARVGGGVKACRGKEISNFQINTTLIARSRPKGAPISLAMETTDVGFGQAIYRVEFEFVPCSEKG